MDNIIKVHNLNFRWKNQDLFNDFTMNIKASSFTTIIGSHDSGKTTLAKIINGLIKTDAEIIVDGLSLLKNVNEIRKKISIVFEENNFVTDTVIDDLAFNLENIGYSKQAIKERINEVAELLNIYRLLERKTNSLSPGEKQLISFAAAIITKPQIIILVDSLSMIDGYKKEKILKILKELNKKDKTTIINFSTDIEDTLYGNQTIIIDNGKIILEGNTKKVLSNEKVLAKYNYALPFMHDLSTKLNYYGLLETTYYDIDEMVNAIWK